MQINNTRIDIATRKPYPKDMLLRFVTEPSLRVCPFGGRGFYLLKDGSTLEIALKKRSIEKLLKHQLSEEEIALLKEALWTKS